MNFDNIDFKNHTIKVSGKGSRERVIPISDKFSSELYLYLKTRLPLENRALFISSAGNRLSATGCHNIFQSLLNRAGFEKNKYSLHKLRHSFASNLVFAGASLNSIRELLGHTSVVTTGIYTHNTSEHLKQTISLLPYE